MKKIIAISASPSSTSKTAAFADYVLAQLENEDVVEVSHLRLRELNGISMLSGNLKDDILRGAIERVEEADAVIIATPIFKASYSGLLKAFLDVMPQFGLAGKVVLPLATGGSVAHVLALDYALRPVLQSMGARHIVQSYFLPESQVVMNDGAFAVSAEGSLPLAEAIYHLRCALATPPGDVLLGHPRPSRPHSDVAQAVAGACK